MKLGKGVRVAVALALFLPVPLRAFAQLPATPDTWSEVRRTTPVAVGAGGGIAATDDPDLFLVMPGGGSTALYRFTVSSGAWTLLPVAPFAANSGSTITWMPGKGHLYLLAGAGVPDTTPKLARFDVGAGPSGTWSTLPSPPAMGGVPLGRTYTAEGLAATSSRVYASMMVSSWGPYHAIYDPALGWQPMANHNYVHHLAYPGTGDIICGSYGTYSISGNAWTYVGTLPSAPNAPGAAGTVIYASDPVQEYDPVSKVATTRSALPGVMSTAGGSAARSADGSKIAMLRGSGTELWIYTIATDRFGTGLAMAPSVITGGALAMTGAYAYAVRSSVNGEFQRYSTAGDQWTPMATMPVTGDPAGYISLCSDGGNFIYGASSWMFRRYSIALNQWLNDVQPFPNQTSHYRIAMANGAVYAVQAYSAVLYRYSPQDNQWTTLAAPPDTFGLGGSLAWPGGDVIYAVQGRTSGGAASPVVWAYSISANSWNVGVDPVDLPEAPGMSLSFLAGPNGKTLFLLAATGKLWMYSIAGDTWTQKAAPPADPGSGVSLASPGSGEFLYAVEGGDSRRFWCYQTPNSAPAAPTGLAQFRLDDTTSIAPAGITIEDGWSVRVAPVIDPDDDAVQLEIRAAAVGAAFPVAPMGTGSPVSSGSAPSATVTGLAAGVSWRWQARTIDPRGAASAWVSFGTNPDLISEVDLRTRTNVLPTSGIALQRDPETGATVATGGSVTGGRRVTMEIAVADGDLDVVSVDIEATHAAGASQGVTAVAVAPSGGTATATITLPAAGPWTWRYRLSDPYATSPAWIDYGGNAAAEPDFRIFPFGSSDGHCLSSADGDRAAPMFAILLGIVAAAGTASVRRTQVFDGMEIGR